MEFIIEVVNGLLPLYVMLVVVLIIYLIKYEIVKEIAERIVNKLDNVTFNVSTGESVLAVNVIKLTIKCDSKDLNRKDIILKEVLSVCKQYLYPIYSQISIEIIDMSKKNCYGNLGTFVEGYTFDRSELKKVNLENLTPKELYIRLPKLCSEPML